MADEKTQEQPREPTKQEGQPEESQTDSQEQQEENTGGGGPDLMSPEGLMMMLIAGTIDSIGIILLFFGLDDFGVTDFIAYSIIGLWMLIRGMGFKKPKGGSAKAAKMAKRLKWLRPLAFIGELVPYWGALPMWTVLVYSELQT